MLIVIELEHIIDCMKMINYKTITEFAFYPCKPDIFEKTYELIK